MDILKAIKNNRKGIMGFAALWIMILHIWYPFFGEINKQLAFIESVVIGSGYTGVDILLFLSGMGLYFSLKRNNVLTFYTNRLKRIFVPIILTALMYSLVQKWDISLFINNVLGINFYRENIYCFLWFFTAIETLYLLFPIYFHFFEKFEKKSMFTMFVLVIWLILVLCNKSVIRKDLFVFINRIPVFCLGVLLGYYETKETRINNTKLAILLNVILLLFGLYEMHLCHDYNHYILVPYSSNFLPTLIITLSLVPLLSIVFEKMTVLKKLFSILGTMSLELYCLQELINYLIRDNISKLIKSVFVQNVIMALIVLILSYFFYKITNSISNLIFRKKTNQ